MSIWVPALRSSVKDAAPRSGHEWSMLSPPFGDAPAGRFVVTFQADLGCPVPFAKNISLHPSGKSSLELFPSRPTDGRLAIVMDAGRDAVDATASCAQWDRRAGSYNPVSDHQAGGRERQFADGEVVWS